jgi:hypothetical protein
LIATGGEAQYFPPAEDFIVRNSRWITGAIALFLLVGLIGSLRTLKRISHRDSATGTETRLALKQAGLPLIVASPLLGYIFLELLPEQNTDLPTLIRFAPDLGILVSLIFLLAVGWTFAGIVGLSYAWIRGKRKKEDPSAYRSVSGDKDMI